MTRYKRSASCHSKLRGDIESRIGSCIRYSLGIGTVVKQVGMKDHAGYADVLP